MTSHYTTEFLYFPLNQGNLPAGSPHKPKFNISTWDYLDDKVSTPLFQPPSPTCKSSISAAEEYLATCEPICRPWPLVMYHSNVIIP